GGASAKGPRTRCPKFSTFFALAACKVDGERGYPMECRCHRLSWEIIMSRTRNIQRRLCLEPLERREAPATLVSATKLTYQDVDGDNVAVTFSKPILNAGNVNSVFLFNTGTVDGSNATKQQLQEINLTGVGVGR